MSTATIQIEMTPNPNAWKYILPKKIIGSGNATFRTYDECKDIPLAAALIQTGHVEQVYFFDNVITITQDGEVDWTILSDVVKAKIEQNLEGHDASVVKADKKSDVVSGDSSEALRLIEVILNQTIRPALQGDGGDLAIIGYDAEAQILKIHYQGACGSCPSAAAGTMYAIQGILQESVDPRIKVVLA